MRTRNRACGLAEYESAAAAGRARAAASGVADASGIARFASFEFTYICTLCRTLYVSHPSFVLVFAASGAHTAAVPVAEHTW